MKSLGETYDRESAPRRVVSGLVVGAAGALAVLAAICLVAVDGSATAAQARSGVLAGLGVPALLLAVVVVLPASRRSRLGVVAGCALAVAGVWLFWHAYPAQWTGTSSSLAFETAMVYGVGSAVALGFVFSAVATFRLRNNPHGTVELEVVRQGETRTVELSHDRYRELVGDGGHARVLREISGPDREADAGASPEGTGNSASDDRSGGRDGASGPRRSVDRAE